MTRTEPHQITQRHPGTDAGSPDWLPLAAIAALAIVIHAQADRRLDACQAQGPEAGTLGGVARNVTDAGATPTPDSIAIGPVWKSFFREGLRAGRTDAATRAVYLIPVSNSNTPCKTTKNASFPKKTQKCGFRGLSSIAGTKL